MGRFQLKSTARPLELGWHVKLIAEFPPVAGHGEEPLWVKVHAISDGEGAGKYTGIVEDYLTFVKAHGITQGFMLQFDPENICEIRETAP